jgi:hypothetical protein
MFATIRRSGSGMSRWIYGAVLVFAMGTSHAQSLSKMALLLPDGLAVNDVQVTAWTDAAQEQGYQLSILRNADFLLLGAGAKTQYSGIIVPDQVQVSMSDALVNTIQSYVTQGGNIMLVYDAGALTATGFYAIPKSRFSDLVGVDYVLYDALRDRTVGLGPVIGLESTLRAILVPPGKSMPYTAPAGTVTALSDTPRAIRVATNGNSPSTAGTTAQYLPVSPSNPGGLKGHDHAQYFKSEAGVTEGQTAEHKDKLKAKHSHIATGLKREGKALKHKDAVEREAVPSVTPSKLSKGALKNLTMSRLGNSSLGARSFLMQATTVPTDAVHSISGYVYGPLTYPSFVTQGTAQGVTLMSSPQHGLVASSRTVGTGSVLFVNLPLTYLKLSEDAMPMHGFLHLFARGPAKQPRLTNVPDGIGGLVFNWHLDSNEALAPMQTLKNMGVWNNKPFSIHMTAGPDTIVAGDKLGFDLPNNLKAQQFLKDFDLQGHQVGNHGGWIHDYYGINVSETNQAEFQNYLVLNRNAVQATIGHGSTEYSAPQGNNPLWTLTWLQQNGVSSYYSLSHTGTAATRTYRGGALVNPGLWAIPVTPFGVAATFEEFEELLFPEADITQWYKDLMDFASNNETNRMIYAHPPGAVDFPNVMTTMLQYAKQKQVAGKFRWYTMTRLATFMNQRAATTWQSAIGTNGKMRVTASNTVTNLRNLTWAYPKSMYSQPVPVSGTMTVVDQGTDWLVRITSGKNATFEAAPL